jgi:hypothetical protein
VTDDNGRAAQKKYRRLRGEEGEEPKRTLVVCFNPRAKVLTKEHKRALEKLMHLQEEGEELTGDHIANNDIAGEHYRITGDGSKMDAEDAYIRREQGFLTESPGSPGQGSTPSSVSKRSLPASSPSSPSKSSTEKQSPRKGDKRKQTKTKSQSNNLLS